MPELPQRKRLYHASPNWVRGGAVYFITICCALRHKPQLTLAPAFEVMKGAIEHYARSGRWWVELFLAMPDHCHAMASFPECESMERVMRDWKRYVAKRAGVKWQDGFFDHRLCSKESADEKWHYILQNPVRQNLVKDPAEWPCIWEPKSVAR